MLFFFFFFDIILVIYSKYRIKERNYRMEELKYLKSVYEQASESLKEHPAFVKKLKEIEGMISIASTGQGYHYTFYDAKVANDVVEVFLGTCYGIDPKSYYIKDGEELRDGLRDRDGYLYSVSLDQTGNLQFVNLQLEAHREDANLVKYHFDYMSELTEKGSQVVISRRKTGNVNGSDLFTEITYNPVFFHESLKGYSEEEYHEFMSSYIKDFDEVLKYLAKTALQKQKSGKGIWYDWRADRDFENPKQARCREDIFYGEWRYDDLPRDYVSEGDNIAYRESRKTLFDTVANIVPSSYDVMRIDPGLGGAECPTVEQLVEMGYLNSYHRKH